MKVKKKKFKTGYASWSKKDKKLYNEFFRRIYIEAIMTGKLMGHQLYLK